MTQVLYKGVEWRRRVAIEEDGAPMDLTGKAVVLQLRRRTGDAVLVELAVGDGITLLAQSGDTIGKADIALPGADSLSLEVANHVVVVLVDGQVALAPTKLTVRAL